MSKWFCSQNLKVKTEVFGWKKQMREWSWESQKKNDGAEQLPQREKSRTLKIYGLIIKFEQSVSRAEGINKQTIEQRVSIWCGLCIFESVNNCEIKYSKCLKPMINSLPLSTATIGKKIPRLHPKTSHNSEGHSRNQWILKRNWLIIKIFMILRYTRKMKGLGTYWNMVS